MTDPVSYTAADLIDGQDIPAKKGQILRWLREQPMAARSEFILAVCDRDLLVGPMAESAPLQEVNPKIAI